MLDRYITGANVKEAENRWPDSFCIVMDSRKPAEFLLKGNLKIFSMDYIKEIVKSEAVKRKKKNILNPQELNRLTGKILQFF